MNLFWISLLATGFCWTVTTLGAVLVLFLRNISDKAMDAMLGFGGGVMVASSFFSLLKPAVEIAKEQSQPLWLSIPLGFLVGAVIIFLCDLFLHKRTFKAMQMNEGKRRSALLIFAITLHNIPEGLAVGVAFGAAASGNTLGAAFALALGIGIQNFPEGAAVSLPLYRDGMKRGKAFLMGSLSGIAEPIAGCIGFIAAWFISGILPFVLSLAAGCMLAVAFGEIIPECLCRSKNVGLWGLIGGFLVMMMLDILL